MLQESAYNPFWDDYIIETYRAKAYELFIYHYFYSLGNYKESSEFIREHYDILSYHKKDKIWKKLNQQELTQAQKTRLKNIQVINSFLFSEFDDWSRSGWKASNNDKSTVLSKGRSLTKIDVATLTTFTEVEFGSRFGMGRETFEKILQILNNASLNLHTQGGRPTKLSALDRLIITIEHSRNRHTMESIAADYGVSKSRISDAIKWVKKTLVDNGIFLEQVLTGK